MSDTLERIHLADLWPSSAEPVRLLGAFDADGGLDRVVAPDMGPLEWRRAPKQDAGAFARAVCNAILEARHRVPLPGRALSAGLLRANAPPSHPGRLNPEGGHKGSKLADPSEPFKHRGARRYGPRAKAVAE
jgi:hypothetical protein